MHHRWHHLSNSHAWSGLLHPTNKRCNCRKGPWGGESLLTPPQIKPPHGWHNAGPRKAYSERAGTRQPIHQSPKRLPGMVSAQPPHWEGDLPSGSMPSAPPPPPAPERTQPQRGGRTRSALCDPMWLAANFHSSGWRKDLEQILKVYYKYSVNYFMESEWSRTKERFFDHFIQFKKEALELKKAHPLDFMAYIQDLFYQATGLHLDGLGSFTRWIKKENYYHGIVAQQSHLQECPHLAGAPLPRWPQVAPSESHQESQMKSDAQTPSSSRPSVGAMAVPVAETPMAEAPVAQAAVVETSVREAPAEETLSAEAPVAPSFSPTPMETGGMGDGQSWAEQVEAGKEESFQRSRPAKCPHSQSRRRELKSWLPFPLQDRGEVRLRHAAV